MSSQSDKSKTVYSNIDTRKKSLPTVGSSFSEVCFANSLDLPARLSPIAITKYDGLGAKNSL